MGLVCLLAATLSAQSPVLEQRIPLARGWNLISLQVSGAEANDGFRIGQPDASLVRASQPGQTSAVVQLWAYDPGQGFTGRVPEKADFPDNARLETIVPGPGYWLYVNDPATLILRGQAWNGVVDIPGNEWALVGFPGVVQAEGEVFDLGSLFGGQLPDVEEIWTWDAGLRRFVGYQPYGRPPMGDLRGVEPGKGYWVKLRRPFRAQAQPVTFLPPDVDVAPLADRTENSDGEIPQGDEDKPFDLDGDGRLDSAISQRTVVFDVGVNTQTLSLANRGTGLISWTVDNAIPWLTNSPSAGVVGTETDTITLSANRAQLLRENKPPGRYTNVFTLYFGDTPFLFTAIVVIPTSAGDYRGAATIARVNGKEIPLGKVDLHLSLFDDEPTPAGAWTGRYFHAVINRDQALLFPQDAFLRGVFYSGNNFTLTTTFTMPAGDRNMPPYETFRTPAPGNAPGGILFNDLDQNGNGQLDNLNPFPFPVGRQITLIGARTEDGLLEGTYVEAVKDAIANQVIYLEGTFSLTRESLQPSQRTAYVGRSEATSESIGGSVSSSYTNTVEVPNSIVISQALVRINISGAASTNFNFTLISPMTNSFELVETNGYWLARGVNGNQGQGTWQLVVSWDGSANADNERSRFLDWELNLIGFNYRSVTVHLLRDTGTAQVPLAGANLTLIGGYGLNPVTGAPSDYTFNELTEDSYVLRADYPGYQSASVSFTLGNTNLDLAPLVLRPFVNTIADLRAEPFVGSAPLFVRHIPRVPRVQFEALGTNVVGEWFLGNGERRTVQSAPDAPIEITYTNAGFFSNVLVLTGSAGTLSLTNTVHAHALVPDPLLPELASTYIQPIVHIGSLASDAVVEPHTTNVAIIVEGRTNRLLNVRSGTVPGESQRDVAGFDFIRGIETISNRLVTNLLNFSYQSPIRMRSGNPPLLITDTIRKEYPEGAGFQLYTNLPPRRIRMEITLGGSVFGPFEYPNRPWRDETAKVGDILLQTGRIEP